jgi:hypothetical protein
VVRGSFPRIRGHNLDTSIVVLYLPTTVRSWAGHPQVSAPHGWAAALTQVLPLRTMPINLLDANGHVKAPTLCTLGEVHVVAHWAEATIIGGHSLGDFLLQSGFAKVNTCRLEGPGATWLGGRGARPRVSSRVDYISAASCLVTQSATPSVQSQLRHQLMLAAASVNIEHVPGP